jgi:hypothetical protein
VILYTHTEQTSHKKERKKDMWIFEAHYMNMETEEESAIKIEFDGQFLGSEKEAYLYAMEKAYDRKSKEECLESVEFIAC